MSSSRKFDLCLFILTQKYFKHAILVMSMAMCHNIGQEFAWILCSIKFKIYVVSFKLCLC